ncbi:TIGR02453 family protein [Bacteroidia bacterium]|nr:TIGR02453 family protein [Bacteroidia bacterium]
MKQIIPFLKQLAKNNHKEWFDLHRDEYKIIRKNYYSFVDELIEKLSKFDNSIAGLTAKDVVFRINRDIRFSNNKNPYKTNFGAYICPNGKKSGYGGYYLHIEPKMCMFATGVYMTEPAYLNSIREDILAKGKDFVLTIKKAKGFSLDEDDVLKNVPKGFPKDTEYADYLKMKNICLVKFFDEKMLDNSDELMKFCVDEFKKTIDFNKFLNRAIDFLKNS